MRRLPPLTALRAFEAAARHGNFVKAAAELGVTPGAISQHIKGLEAQLGLSLFQRQARGVRLTEAGRAYLPGVAEGFDRLARATLQVHDGRRGGRRAPQRHHAAVLRRRLAGAAAAGVSRAPSGDRSA